MLSDHERVELGLERVKAESEAVAAWVRKLEAVAPEPGSLDSRDYITAIGALWYMMLWALADGHNSRTSIQTDLNANLLAALIAQDRARLAEAVQRAMGFVQMADPETKA